LEQPVAGFAAMAPRRRSRVNYAKNSMLVGPMARHTGRAALSGTGLSRIVPAPVEKASADANEIPNKKAAGQEMPRIADE
jgi:hypothetical protein